MDSLVEDWIQMQVAQITDAIVICIFLRQCGTWPRNIEREGTRFHQTSPHDKIYRALFLIWKETTGTQPRGGPKSPRAEKYERSINIRGYMRNISDLEYTNLVSVARYFSNLPTSLLGVRRIRRQCSCWHRRTYTHGSEGGSCLEKRKGKNSGLRMSRSRRDRKTDEEDERETTDKRMDD